MKCIITGHTTGLGKALYDNLSSQGHEVIGVSRSSGYDLLENFDKVVKVSEGCDLFINNTYVGDYQLRLLNSLYNKVSKMIVIGSIAGDYNDLIKSEYSANKLALANRCKEISLLPGNSVLHLKISMLEDAVSGDNLISFTEVSDIVNFWIQNPRVSAIDLEFKLTPLTLEKIKEKFGATQEAIDYVLSNMCSEKRQSFND